MLAKVLSSAVHGIDGYIVEVEVDISNGLPQFDVVGLPDASVREARERVRSAIKNSGFEFPLKRITVNLAPANRRKHGSGLDLPISLGILVASNQIPASLTEGIVSVGELSLDGVLRPIHGTLPISLSVRDSGLKGLLLPALNIAEACVINGTRVYGVRDLPEAIAFLKGEVEPSPQVGRCIEKPFDHCVDLRDVHGQEMAKRALEISAAGGHNILMIGPPGSGKTMLAQRMTTILPDLTEDESLEVSKIYSVAGLIPPGAGLLVKRPWRSPHHGISQVAMIGGGKEPKPGEVTLAHHGVLFLDEMSQFKKEILDSLRTPMEDGCVTISRISGTFKYPSRFMLVGSTNPCSCGYYGDPAGRCTCTEAEVGRYFKKFSGPLMDRFDIFASVKSVTPAEILGEEESTPSVEILKRVVKARNRQVERLKPYGISSNAQLPPELVKRFCRFDNQCKILLEKALASFRLSSRAYHRILKVALTISDLEGSDKILADHIAEAIQYRARR